MLNVRHAKPIIGVTGPDEGGGVAWFCSRAMIWWAGGRALRITPNQPQQGTPIHGLLLGGGADIHPSRYREQLLHTIQKESHKVRRINMRFLVSIALWLMRKVLSVQSSRNRKDDARDQLEFSLLEECVEKGIPVLGICRGGQLINVYWGGTLHQNISGFYTESPQLRTIRARKLIHVESGTTLSRILNRSQAKVNSLHDQSVKDLGKGLRIAARETNGVVQAIEHRTLPFMLGVQWHPEFMPLNPEQRRVFHFLVQAARVYMELCPRRGEFLNTQQQQTH